MALVYACTDQSAFFYYTSFVTLKLLPPEICLFGHHTVTIARLEIGRNIPLHFLSGDDVQVKASENLVTAREVLVSGASIVVAAVTILVTVPSPALF